MAQKSNPTPAASLPVSPESPITLSNQALFGLTFGLAALYFVYSTRSQGFYQQDEANHYVNMLRFWHEPNSVLGNWAKAGYKVLYALPALLGLKAVTLLNCLLAAFSAFFAYKAAEKQGAQYPLLAFLLLATQPFWISLSFRNYSEVPTAFLLVAAYYAHLVDRRWLAGLLLSYITTIRQEFIPFVGLYGLFLLYKREWLSAGLMFLFPLAYNIWGWQANPGASPFYLFDELLGQSSQLGDLYPRKGFDHYFLTSAVVFGPAILTLTVVWLGSLVKNRKNIDWFLLVPVVGYFLLQCLFNWQAVPIGPATGGNLRYLIIISPLLAIAGSQVLEQFASWPQRWYYLPVLLVLIIVVASFMSYDHNFIQLTEEPDNKPQLGVILFSAFLFVPLKGWTKIGVSGALLLVLGFMNLKPVKLSAEDEACRDLAKWYQQNQTELDQRQVYAIHPMFYFWLERTDLDFPKPVKTIVNVESFDDAPVGSYFLWDSHYSYNPKRYKHSFSYEYFQNKPDMYQLRQQFITPEQNFGVLVFEKVK